MWRSNCTYYLNSSRFASRVRGVKSVVDSFVLRNEGNRTKVKASRSGWNRWKPLLVNKRLDLYFRRSLKWLRPIGPMSRTSICKTLGYAGTPTIAGPMLRKRTISKNRFPLKTCQAANQSHQHQPTKPAPKIEMLYKNMKNTFRGMRKKIRLLFFKAVFEMEWIGPQMWRYPSKGACSVPERTRPVEPRSC